MKVVILSLMLVYFGSTAVAQNNKVAAAQDVTKAIQTVEVSCGKCKFKLPGTGCDLAVRVDGKAYYADGVSIDDLGDAHAHDGMCNAIRKAEVQGEVTGDRYQISYIKLLPQEKKAKRSKNKQNR